LGREKKHTHFDSQFYAALFKVIFVNVLILVAAVSRQTLNKNSEKYLSGVGFWQLTLAKNYDITA